MSETATSDDRLRRALNVMSALLGVVVLLLGITVIVGWHIGSPRLVQIRSSFAPMQYNTALAFCGCGVALVLLVSRKPQWAAVAGGIAAGIGALTLVEYVGGVNLGIDELLMEHDITTNTSDPGRMAPNTALCFVLTGVSMLVQTWRLSSRIRGLLTVLFASLVFGLGIVALFGYYAQLETAYGWGNWTRMAIHTSAGFGALGIGLVVLVWSQSVTSESWLPNWLPVPVAISVLTATLCFWQALHAEGTRIANQYSGGMTGVTHLAWIMLIAGVVLALTLATVAYLAQMSLSRARQLDKTNLSLCSEIQTRKEAERALQAHRDSLEQAVQQRTRQLEAARQEAEKANRAKSEFLSHMSHELRTPLNGILGYAQILKRHTDLPEDQRHHLDAIISCGDHLLSLINDVLDLSKIEAQRVEVDLAPLELAKLVIGVTDIVRERAQQKGIELTVDVALAIPPWIIADSAKMRQMLVNLLGNAVKFTERGSVTLRVGESPPGTLRFDVTDTGIGMSADELKHIFDPFKQVEAGKAAGGTGLGLAITKNLAEILGATLSVDSTQGKGSTFTIALPLIEAPPADPLADSGSTDALFSDVVLAEGQACTILIVDDRDTNLRVLEGMLKPMGFRVRLATDGDEGLAQLRAHPDIALTLMDIRMPRVSGIEAIKQIRQDENLRDAKVIAVTASVYPEFRKQALAAGFDGFLAKPLRIDELLSKLQRHLSLEFVPRSPAASATETQPVETDRPADPGATIAGPVRPQLVKQLWTALRIKNVTAIKGLAQQLASEAATAAVGERILRLARQFDFVELAKVLDELEQHDDIG